MDIEKVILAIIAAILGFLSKNLWDVWRENKKRQLEERTILNQVLFQFINVYKSVNTLQIHIEANSESFTYLTKFTDFHIKNIDKIYEQIEGLLKELAKSDPITAAGIRQSQYNDALFKFHLLKGSILHLAETSKNEKKQPLEILKANATHIGNFLLDILEITKITLYILASKIDKDTLESIATSYPDKRLAGEFHVKQLEKPGV